MYRNRQLCIIHCLIVYDSHCCVVNRVAGALPGSGAPAAPPGRRIVHYLAQDQGGPSKGGFLNNIYIYIYILNIRINICVMKLMICVYK